ncbi:hypothetical protein EDB89DRAFT_1934756 [Lactarius sanguifluus]|nr:hypothetical protein EDB89DRAFT_1934756 [Lactarius sanguifluus]
MLLAMLLAHRVRGIPLSTWPPMSLKFAGMAFCSLSRLQLNFRVLSFSAQFLAVFSCLRSRLLVSAVLFRHRPRLLIPSRTSQSKARIS